MEQQSFSFLVMFAIWLSLFPAAYLLRKREGSLVFATLAALTGFGWSILATGFIPPDMLGKFWGLYKWSLMVIWFLSAAVILAIVISAAEERIRSG